jgi:FkbM family methyltransferase
MPASVRGSQHWLMRVRPAYLASFMKKALRIRRRVIETPQGRFFIDPASNFGCALLSRREFEPGMIAVLRRFLGKGDAFVDLGANEGYFSCIASKLVGESGQVISIEPQSRLQSVIFRNMQENQAFNIAVLQCAVADGVGMATLSLTPDMNPGGSGLFRSTKYKTPTESIPQTTLARILSLIKLETIKLLKMDIESFEYEAILGSKELFHSGRIKNIALELHPSILQRRGKSSDEILAFLKECGYEVNQECENLVLSRS